MPGSGRSTDGSVASSPPNWSVPIDGARPAATTWTCTADPVRSPAVVGPRTTRTKARAPSGTVTAADGVRSSSTARRTTRALRLGADGGRLAASPPVHPLMSTPRARTTPACA